jgi:hypothetical protein
VTGKYLSVCPMSMAFISLPGAFIAGEGSCGGRRLNRYTAVMEVMFEALPGVASNNRFGRAPNAGGGRVDDEDSLTSADGGAGVALIPIFSTAAYAETEVNVTLMNRMLKFIS